MIRSANLFLLAAAFATAIWTQVPSSATGAAASAGVHAIEPVVIFDTTGSAFAGSIHEHLTVYNSGFVTISKRNDNPFGNLDIDVQTANVGSAVAMKLLIDLVAAGAVTLPDQNVSAADIPLKTLTILEGKELALSRTFSYWDGIDQYGAVATVLNEFITDTFPGF